MGAFTYGYATDEHPVILLLNFWIWGLSPGHWQCDNGQRIHVVTRATVAAVSQGNPNKPQSPLREPIRSRSRWKPEPLSSLRALQSMSLGESRSEGQVGTPSGDQKRTEDMQSRGCPPDLPAFSPKLSN